MANWAVSFAFSPYQTRVRQTYAHTLATTRVLCQAEDRTDHQRTLLAFFDPRFHPCSVDHYSSGSANLARVVSQKLLLSCSQATRDILVQNADKVLTFAELGRKNVCFLSPPPPPSHVTRARMNEEGKLLSIKERTTVRSQCTIFFDSVLAGETFHPRTNR